MRKERLNFGVVLRTIVSLLPMIFGVPTLAIITCSYNIAMSFMVFGPLTAFATSLCTVCFSMFIGAGVGAGGELTALVIGLQAVLSALGCIYGYLYKKKFSLGMYCVAAGILIPEYLYAQYQASSRGLSVVQAMVPSAEEMKNVVYQALSNLPEAELGVLAPEINKIISLTHNFVSMLIPSVFIIISLILAYLVIWAVSVQLRKLPVGMNHSFSRIKIPKTMTIVFLLVILILVLTGVSEKLVIPATVTAVLLNMMFILQTLAMFSGISFIDYFLRKIVRFTAFRVIIYVGTIVAFPVVSIAYTIAGCIDSFADFRKLKPAESIEKGVPHETEE